MQTDEPINVNPVVLQPGDVPSVELAQDPPAELSDVALAVPEHPHVGESASTGLAEKAVQ